MENNQYIKNGDKILCSFSLFRNKEKKLDKAMEFYKKALKKFFRNKDFLNYAILSEKIADEYLKINNDINALTNYKNAQNYYLDIDINKFINITINKIIPLYIENNNLINIGKSYYKLAQLYKDNIHIPEISDYFKKAITYLEIEKSHELLSCHIDFTFYLIDCNNIDNAIYILEEIINQMCKSNMLLLRVNVYVFLFLLCIMTKNDIVFLKQKFNKYCEISYKFINYPGHKFIELLIETYENNDINNFTDLIYEYDKTYKLRPREVKLLVIVKNNLKLNNGIDLE
jgi:hypothetical protein